MITAYSSRLYLTLDHGFVKTSWGTKIFTDDSCEQLRCNCPICHAEELLSTEAESFDYQPFFTTLTFEFAVCHTAEANNIATLSSLRGPPYLS